MATKAFYVSYWDKEYLNSQFPERENTAENKPYFQLSVGKASSLERVAISKPTTFTGLVFSILLHLKKQEALCSTYQLELTDDASSQIANADDKRGKEVLEGIVASHNDFVTPS